MIMGILDRIENINGIQLSMGSLSDYQIDESIGNKGRIGYGGFSTVYAMRRRGTLYAVKIPNQANIWDPESSIKFPI